jgi:hypothetical protein
VLHHLLTLGHGRILDDRVLLAVGSLVGSTCGECVQILCRIPDRNLVERRAHERLGGHRIAIDCYFIVIR